MQISYLPWKGNSQLKIKSLHVFTYMCVFTYMYNVGVFFNFDNKYTAKDTVDLLCLWSS